MNSICHKPRIRQMLSWQSVARVWRCPGYRPATALAIGLMSSCVIRAMHDFRKSLVNSALRKVFNRLHCPLGLRHIGEMMRAWGVFVDHATVHLWSIKMAPVLAAVFRRRKHPVGKSWRTDETYIWVAGEWKYLYRPVDREGYAAACLLIVKRDLAAARWFLECSIKLHDVPDRITIDSPTK